MSQASSGDGQSPPTHPTPRQLALRFVNPGRASFANFHIGANGELVERLVNLAAGAERPGLWLWGNAGVGCSHLLLATCEAAAAAGQPVAYLPLAELARDPEVLDGVAGAVVAIDDLQLWLGERALESMLVGLYQDVTHNGGALLFGSDRPAARLTFALADLGSRLRALPGAELKPPDDDGLKRLLGAAARQRGLSVPPAVLDFWLHRSSRHYPTLLAELERLDAMAMAEQRPVTIPLIKRVLGL